MKEGQRYTASNFRWQYIKLNLMKDILCVAWSGFLDIIPEHGKWVASDLQGFKIKVSKFRMIYLLNINKNELNLYQS
jgi:hypothetical protein